MKEDFLHYVWKYKAFQLEGLKTVKGAAVRVVNFGQHNLNSGPDFINAQVVIDEQLWAGNVEIHLKSSDWFVHHHEKDQAYDSVILHVVWEDDVEVFNSNNYPIPALELQSYVQSNVLLNYQKLMKSKRWINCESHFGDVEAFLLDHWIERLFLERLEKKSSDILQLLYKTNNDWEAVFFMMLTKNFGLKVNGDAFFSLAQSIAISILRKTAQDPENLEALLFGQAHLLEEDVEDVYVVNLKKRYNYLKQKYNLQNGHVLKPQFFRLRPANFPTIRLSQLAQLYVKESRLFSKIIALNDVEDFYELFAVSASSFWTSHYTFSKTSKPREKKLTKSVVDLFLINTIIPFKFCYAKAKGKSIEADLFRMVKNIDLEQNSVVKKFKQLRSLKNEALNSQALLQLKERYCDRNKCLSCAIGNHLIAKK